MPRRDAHDIDPALAEAVRRTYVRPVDDDVAARHVTQIADAARAGGTSARPAPVVRAGRRPWRPALALASALLILPVALATAGIDLPGPVDAPYREVGIELPNQSSEPASEPPARSHPVTTPAAPTARPAPPVTTPRRAIARQRAKRAEQRHRRAQAHRRRGRSGETPAATGTTPQRRNGRATVPGQLRKGTVKRAATSPTRKPTRPITPRRARKRPHSAKPRPQHPAKPVTPKRTPPPQTQTTPQQGNGNGRGPDG